MLRSCMVIFLHGDYPYRARRKATGSFFSVSCVVLSRSGAAKPAAARQHQMCHRSKPRVATCPTSSYWYSANVLHGKVYSGRTRPRRPPGLFRAVVSRAKPSVTLRLGPQHPADDHRGFRRVGMDHGMTRLRHFDQRPVPATAASRASADIAPKLPGPAHRSMTRPTARRSPASWAAR